LDDSRHCAVGPGCEANWIRGLRAYLLWTKPNYGDDRAFRLLGLFWTDAKQDQIDAAARGLVA
jgi:hypothetical protein